MFKYVYKKLYGKKIKKNYMALHINLIKVDEEVHWAEYSFSLQFISLPIGTLTGTPLSIKIQNASFNNHISDW